MYIKGCSGFILTVYMVYLFLMLILSIQREMHTQDLHMFCLFLMLTQSIQNIYTHISAPNFLNIQPIFNLKKFWKAETQGFSAISSNPMYVNTVNANCEDF